MENCPVCGVAIAGDKVLFSAGKPGTRARLYARVCQYAKAQGCINQGEHFPAPDDYWIAPPGMTPEKTMAMYINGN